ncbi:hypothetical protein BGX28_001636, partial [Mortierella sp. GBA30]
MLLSYLYSGKLPHIPYQIPKVGQQNQAPSDTPATHFKMFIDRASELGLLQTRDARAGTDENYPASSLLRSVAQQLFTEVKRLYRNGCIELEKKLKTMKAKGLVSDETHSEIDYEVPAIENYLRLNKCSKSYRRTVPFARTERPFVSFSERELVILFWQNSALKTRLQDLVLEGYENKEFDPSQSCVIDWLRGVAPGYLIIEMLSNVGRNEPRKGPRDYKDSTCTMDESEMRAHILKIRQPDFNPQTPLKHKK